MQNIELITKSLCSHCNCSLTVITIKIVMLCYSLYCKSITQKYFCMKIYFCNFETTGNMVITELKVFGNFIISITALM